MNMFGDPVAVLMALLAVVVCFATPMIATLFVIKKIGLWERVKREIAAGNHVDPTGRTLFNPAQWQLDSTEKAAHIKGDRRLT